MKPSGINTIFIKTEQKHTFAPHPGQRVHIQGDPETYVVLQVDSEKKLANLVSTGQKHSVKEAVPFDSMQAAGTGLAEALQRMLKSA